MCGAAVHRRRREQGDVPLIDKSPRRHIRDDPLVGLAGVIGASVDDLVWAFGPLPAYVTNRRRGTLSMVPAAAGFEPIQKLIASLFSTSQNSELTRAMSASSLRRTDAAGCLPACPPAECGERPQGRSACKPCRQSRMTGSSAGRTVRAFRPLAPSTASWSCRSAIHERLGIIETKIPIACIRLSDDLFGGIIM